MSRTILVPVDGSDPSRGALRYGAGIARESGGTVHVLAVAHPSSNPLAFGVETVEEIERAVDDLVDAIAAVEDFSGVRFQSEVRRGQPTFEVILTYAADIGADLLVVGRTGTTSISEAVLGSTADRLARSATVPVVIVPETPLE